MSDNISRQPKPCPFCGGIAIVDMDEDWYWEWKAFCPKCGCDLGYFKTKEEAIKAWNKRADQPPADPWIPCSSGRMPKHEQKVFITIHLTKDKRYATAATYFTETGVVFEDEWADEGFYTYDSEYGWGRYENVIAWMPAEPYKGVE